MLRGAWLTLACHVGHETGVTLRDRQAHCCMRMLRVLEGPQWRRALPETYCTVRYYCTAPTLSTSGLCLAVDRDWRLAIPQTRQTFYCIGREPWFQDGHCRNPRARLHYISSSAPTLHLLHCAAAYTARRMAIVFGTTSIDVDDVATGYLHSGA